MPNRRLDAAYAAQVKAIRTRVQTFALARFRAGQYRDVNLGEFVKQAVPIIAAGQRQISSLTDSYLSMTLTSMLGTKVPMRGAIDTSNLRGVPLTDVYERPFVTVRTKLSQGMPYDLAVQAGTARLVDLVLTDMQMAKTYTAQNVLSNSSERVTGYERTLTGSQSCGLCVVASTQRYRKSDLMPIHPGCDCGVEPIIDRGVQVINPERLAQIHKSVGDFFGGNLDKSLQSSARAPDYRELIAVHEHGEIGPVLSIKGQKFTGPSIINK